MPKFKSTSKFISDCMAVHGTKYDYTKVEYVNSRTPVMIICPEHGEFSQIPNVHTINKSGCPKCSVRAKPQCVSKSHEQFLIDARTKHGEKYDYSLTQYVNAKTLISIICPKHGTFHSTPNNRLCKGGCRACTIERHAIAQTRNINEFVNAAVEIYGSSYNYSKSIYTRSNIKLEIVCSIHGSFWKTPNHHLQGQGCPQCVRQTSYKSAAWLDSLGIERREVPLSFINEKRTRKVDGYDDKTKTVFQFHGSFWHGHPDIYDKDLTHPIMQQPFGILYEQTLRFDNNIRATGYNLVTMWEHEFDKAIKCVS